MGNHFILVLASDMKRFSFMSMYERNFVLRWVMSIASAEELARIDNFDFALVNFDSDPHRAIKFCHTLKTIQPQTQIVFLKAAHVELPENFCADVVLDSEISESELATHLQNYIRRSA